MSTIQILSALTLAGIKIVCLNNVEQIDTPYRIETASGPTYAGIASRTGRTARASTLRSGEHSRLAGATLPKFFEPTEAQWRAMPATDFSSMAAQAQRPGNLQQVADVR